MALKYAVNNSDVLSDLVLWCPLNEESDGTGAVTRYDAHNGVVFTDNNTTPSTTGDWNRAANFQKANSESIDTTDVLTDITSDFSFSVRVNFTTITSGQLRPFFGKDGSGQRSYAAWLFNNSGTHQLRLFISSNGSNAEEIIVTPSTGNFSTGTWYTIGGSWDASASEAEFYVDGSSVGSNTGSFTSINNGNTPFYIGRFGNFSGDYTDAKQQDFALWDAVKDASVFEDVHNGGDGMTYGVDYWNQTGSFDNAHSLGTDFTFSHSVGGTNPNLLVEVMSATASSIDDADYGGDAMTEVDSYATGPGIFDQCVLYALAAPSSGSNTVTIGTSGAGTTNVYAKASTYIGANQTTPNPHSGKNTGTNTTLTLSIDTSTSPSTDNCWIAAAGFTDGNYTQSAGSGTFRRTSLAGIDNWLSMFDNNIAISPAGSDSLVVNISTSSLINVIGCSIAPVTEAAASTDAYLVGYNF